MKRYELDNYKDEIVNLYIYDKLSCKKIADIYGAHLNGVYDALKRWGINMRSLSESHKTYTIDDNYFKVIDTEDKAYWLGFFYADGYITLPHCIGLSLGVLDKSHIIKFLNFASSDYPLNEYESNGEYGNSKYVRFLIRNQTMYEQLQKNGVKLRKSLILEYPEKDILPLNLNRHFIRGYFDGDGSLVLSPNSINFKICGTKEFLLKVIEILNKETNYCFKEKLFKRRNDNKNSYYISFGGTNKTKEVMHYLYKDSSIYLDRKYEKYLRLLNM